MLGFQAFVALEGPRAEEEGRFLGSRCRKLGEVCDGLEDRPGVRQVVLPLDQEVEQLFQDLLEAWCPSMVAVALSIVEHCTFPFVGLLLMGCTLLADRRIRSRPGCRFHTRSLDSSHRNFYSR